MESARATLGDVSGSLRDYAEGINASPERLAEIEDRLAVLDRLKRKYGKTVAEVIAFGEEVGRKLAEVEDRDEILKALRAELDEAAVAYRAAASAISADRKAAADKLAKLAETQINSLAMKVRFEIVVQSPEDAGAFHPGGKDPSPMAPSPKAAALKGHDFSRAESSATTAGALAPERSSSENSQSHWTATGWDEVEYRIATNPGEPLKPLARDRLRRRDEPRNAGAEGQRGRGRSQSRKAKPRRPEPWSSTKSISASAAARPKPSGKS